MHVYVAYSLIDCIMWLIYSCTLIPLSLGRIMFSLSRFVSWSMCVRVNSLYLVIHVFMFDSGMRYLVLSGGADFVL